MSKPRAQSLKNHTRFDVPYLGITFILCINVIYSVVHLVRHLGWFSAWFVVLSLAAVMALLKVRQYPLKVQDRVIRLEERLRLQALAPAEWHPQIYRLSEGQLIGLRFADDQEVVALAQQALAENLTRKQIKERIRNWRADDWRV